MDLSLLFLPLLLLAPLSASSAAFSLSEGILGSGGVSIGRNLLQAKTPCPINFEYMNYTIITSRCKGPNYPPKECCQALKDFACPISKELNDLRNDCAEIMFSYINIYGKYPRGLFSSECKDGKLGLDCPVLPPSSGSGSLITHPSHLLLLTTTILVFLLGKIYE